MAAAGCAGTTEPPEWRYPRDRAEADPPSLQRCRQLRIVKEADACLTSGKRGHLEALPRGEQTKMRPLRWSKTSRWSFRHKSSLLAHRTLARPKRVAMDTARPCDVAAESTLRLCW